MDRQALEQYVYEHIPIIKVNALSISKATTKSVTVTGNLQDHVNHRNSVFGGSIASAMTLAAWAQVRLIMEEREPNAVIVIQRENVSFERPVLKDFAATSQEIEQGQMERFHRMFEKMGKARLTVRAAAHHRGESDELAVFTGEFVVFRQEVDIPS